MRRNQALTRVTCSGIVEADGYATDDIHYLRSLGVATLSVSEIENVVLLPAVSRAIAESEGFAAAEIESRLASLKDAIFEPLGSAGSIDAVVTRYCRRPIDRLLKNIDLSSASNAAEINSEYQRQTASLDISRIANEAIGL